MNPDPRVVDHSRSRVQPSPHIIADAGDLEKLPLELRKQVYAYLLVESKSITLPGYDGIDQERPHLRCDHCRDCAHGGEFFYYHPDNWVTAPPGTSSLLRVNKALNQEAAEVLYGLNGFEFKTPGSLEYFLETIGNSRQYLRRITFFGTEILNKYFDFMTDRSLELLAEAGGFRSLEISHATLCGGWSDNQVFSIQELATHFTPFLKSLKATFNEQNLDSSILDVIKIVLPPCKLDSNPSVSHKAAHIFRGFNSVDRWFVLYGERGFYMRGCNCLCTEAEEKNREFVRDLRKDIGLLPGLNTA